MSCSMTQHGDACGDQTQDLSIRSLMLYHCATEFEKACALSVLFSVYDHVYSYSDDQRPKRSRQQQARDFTKD